MNYKVDVSIIIVGMNHLRHLKNFFESFYYHQRPKFTYEFIYVDNASTDGSVEFLQEFMPEVRVFSDGKIRGFSENNNLGVMQSAGRVLLFLNPDIIFLEGSLDNMFSYLISNSDIGILVPKLLNEDLSIQRSIRKFISLKVAFLRVIYAGRDDVQSSTIQNYLLSGFNYDETQKVEWALGAAMMIRKDWYYKIGGFDERYFLYVEDVDICFQSWKCGKPVIYYPTAVLIHAHLRASKSSMKLKFRHANSVLKFIRKHNLLSRSYQFQS